MLFLERVYGIETQELFYKILEEAFLPDLRAATMLDRVRIASCLFYFVRYIYLLLSCHIIIHLVYDFKITKVHRENNKYLIGNIEII